ncbi:hypothetical protein [Caballeronia sp. GACF4]|uniref:hypothetical protein n=1 Tax=Caballeronia sp. GACF4 TaxID=2921763 RepID=UPI002028EC09|nr:hypothetical protein [Caballeronia sp. GACF4]
MLPQKMLRIGVKKRDGGHFKDGPKVDNHEILGNDAYSRVDAAGLLCVHTLLEKFADRGIPKSLSRAVTKIGHPYDVKSSPLRCNKTKKAFQVLGISYEKVLTSDSDGHVHW